MPNSIPPRLPSIGYAPNSTERRQWILDRLKLITAAYRKNDFHDADGYILQAAMVLERYSNVVIAESTDPLTGIQSHIKFPPTLAELREFCDEVNRRSSFGKQYDLRSREQLRERAENEREYEPPELRRLTAERIMTELRAAMAAPPPPDSYAAMFAKYGRPRGPFENRTPPHHPDKPTTNGPFKRLSDEELRALYPPAKSE